MQGEYLTGTIWAVQTNAWTCKPEDAVWEDFATVVRERRARFKPREFAYCQIL
jgi:hypothetical protein